MTKIGSIISILLSIATSVMAQHITISLSDSNGMPVSSCMQGMVYTFNISLYNIQSSNGIQFNMPDGWQMHTGKTVKRHIENNNITITYIYRVSPEQVGMSTFGPIEVQTNHNKFVSNVITVSVKEKTAQQVNVNNAQQKAILVCNIPVTQAYVGQEIPCNLQFCYLPNQVSLEQIGKVEVPHAHISDWSDPITGSKEINGLTYEYIEWRWFMRFTQPGNYELPAYRSDYVDVTKRSQARNAFDLFFASNSLQTIYSNTNRLTIYPLPAHESNTQAVGQVQEYTIACDKTSCTLGDAVIVSLTIKGQGNFADIATPVLRNIPTALKYYDSKKEIHASPELTVCFEYVIQPLAEGVWNIEPQEFVYFDPYDQIYKTISTQALSLIVSKDNTKDSSGSFIYTPSDDTGTIGHIQMNGLSYATPYTLSWRLFFILALLPLLGMIGSVSFCSYHLYNVKNKPFYNAKCAFIYAKKEIKHIKHENQLYHIFLRCFAQRWMVNTDILTEQYIYKKLQKAGISSDLLHKWELFWQQCMQAAFVSYSMPNKDVLYKTALQWCDILEQYM
jgi:hypothetical protein